MAKISKYGAKTPSNADANAAVRAGAAEAMARVDAAPIPKTPTAVTLPPPSCPGVGIITPESASGTRRP